jgi:hypothetical protein
VITVSADGIAKSESTSLTIAPPSAASVQFVSAAPTDQSIVIQGQGGNGRTETATLTFKVVDSFGAPLAGKSVNFTTASPYVKINKTSDTTDETGSVITTVNSGSVATSFRVQATLPGTASGNSPDISTMSDSIVVTTGLPVQRAFSISTGTFNIDGWNIDSSPTSPATFIQVMVADAFGNPVPDGTPIVFQTNMGAVGSSVKGGCNTVNGGCRSISAPRPAHRDDAEHTGHAVQHGPRLEPGQYPPGLATICASSTDGTNTVFAKAAIFFSGSHATKTTMGGVQVSFDTLHPNDLGSIVFGDVKSFQLQLNDENNNPLSSGTSVTITGMLNGSASVTPATVPSIAPHSTSGDDNTGNVVNGAQGSLHTISAFRAGSRTHARRRRPPST